MIIKKIGAVILNGGGQMLVVRKSGTNTYIIPGGKPEPGENDWDACQRELCEELGVEVDSFEYFGSFEEPSEFEDATLKATIYRVAAHGQPRPQNEIAEMAWIDGGAPAMGISLGSVISRHVLPQLIKEGLIKPSPHDQVGQTPPVAEPRARGSAVIGDSGV